MAGSYNAGIVTAYGAAVRGGYTGTYEQFCAQQANYAQTAAAVEQAKTDAQAAAQRAQDVADSIPEDYTELTEEVSNLKDDFHEYHSELGAGYADQLVSGIQNEDSVPYNFRKVPYDATLEKVEGIVGVDVVVNQLIKSLDSSNWSSEAGVTATFGNGVVTISSTVNGNGIQHRTPIAVQAHKYFATMSVYGASGQTVAISGIPATSSIAIDHTISRANTWETASKIVSSGLTGNMSLYALARGGTYENVKMKDIMLFDLTQTFGSQIADYVYGLETATAGAGVAWLKKNFSKIFDAGYIAYNAGTMVHVSGLSAHKTVGFNQWDEEWEVGYIDGSGQNTYSTVNIRSKNYIHILPNATYYLNCPVGTVYCPIYYYDENKKFIKSAVQTLWNRTITIPSGVAYMRFFVHDSYGTTYNHDICINISDPARNGEYEPYEEHTYPLDSTIDLHGILKLDSNNNLYADGDVYKADGSVSRRYGVVDLGTLTWIYDPTNTQFYSDIIISQTGWHYNVICSKYVQNSRDASGMASAHIRGLSGGRVYIVDPDYTDAATFKTAMSGVYLVYELAAPATETAEPYNPNQICDPNGTEEYISETVAPVGHVTKYPLDIAGRLDNILSMPTANGTYTLRATVNNGKVTYSWVSA